jgi:hypothetical protein
MLGALFLFVLLAGDATVQSLTKNVSAESFIDTRFVKQLDDRPVFPKPRPKTEDRGPGVSAAAFCRRPV